jgi:hydroxymethylglutaryl-CoA reductase
MTDKSRIPGFYRKSVTRRREDVAARTAVSLETLDEVLDAGGLSPEAADKIVENVMGVYALPFGIALNVRINDIDRLAPMVVEEPSVIAAASNAARMIRASGGFRAEMLEDLMTAQVQLFDVADEARAQAALEAASSELLELAGRAVPNLLGRGGGPRSIEVRALGEGVIVLHVYVDCRNAMGANLVNTIAEAIGPRVAELGDGVLGLRILSNLCDHRRVRVMAHVRPAELVKGRSFGAGNQEGNSWAPVVPASAEDVAAGIAQASRFASLDPYRAATHNKGIMNGVDAVVLATGNDFRAVEAGAHAYAARSGSYSPLAVWRFDGEDLIGTLEMPLALGTVGGTLRVHPAARLALDIAGIESASDLSLLAACVGLASNLAALRALATEGIQRGHMSLHARSVATAAGAEGTEVERIAREIAREKTVTLEAARSALERLRRGD